MKMTVSRSAYNRKPRSRLVRAPVRGRYRRAAGESAHSGVFDGSHITRVRSAAHDRLPPLGRNFAAYELSVSAELPTAAFAPAASAAVASPPPIARPPVGDAVIGAGAIGYRHAETLAQRLAGARLVGIADPQPA